MFLPHHGSNSLVQAIAKVLEDGAAPQLILLNLRDNPTGAETTGLMVHSFPFTLIYHISDFLASTVEHTIIVIKAVEGIQANSTICFSYNCLKDHY